MRLFNWVPKFSRLNYTPLALSLMMVIGFIIPLLTSSPVFAVTTSPQPSDPNYLNWNIQSNWYRQAVSQCLATIQPYPVINQNDLNSGNWFTVSVTDSGDAPTGYYMRDTLTGIGDNGQIDCWENNNELVTKAMQLWGLDGLTIGCGANMWRRVNKTDCVRGRGDFTPIGSQTDIANAFRNYIRDTIYGGREPQLDNAMQFALYKRTLIMGCAYTNQTPQTTNPGGSNVYAVASFYNGTQDNLNPTSSVQQQTKLQQTTEYYVGDQSPDTQRWLWTNPDSQKTCQELADAIAPNSAYATAYSDYLTRNNVDPTTTTGISSQNTPSGDKSNCTIPGIGWIVCPVTTFLAGIADQVYNVLKALLTVPPLDTDIASKTNGTYIAWSYMRNIANVVFVIVFVVIIYSQISGMGVSNYGIKKLLPKLIVAAILVNASYWVCAIAVDISNILGMSVRGMLDAASSKMPVPPATDPFSHGGVWQFLAVTILASVGVAILGLTILLPIMIAALAAATTAFIVLVLRQALIVMLIFISPLAFVAILLPNTEKWFNRWRETFVTLLLIFPIISLVFGGSNLASRVLTASSITMEGDANGWFIKIVAAGVTVIPLFIVPVLMKVSGGLLGRFAGVVNNPNKGMFDRMRKGSEGLRKSRQTMRDAQSLNRTGWRKALDVRGYDVRRRTRSEAVLKARQRESQLSGAEYIAKTVDEGTGMVAGKLRHDLAGGGGAAGAQRAAISAINTLDQLQTAEVKEANILIQHAELSGKERQELAMNGSVTKDGKTYSGETMQKAAVLNQLKTGSMSDIENIVMNSGGSLSQFKQSISQAVAENGLAAKNPALGGKYLDQIAQGKINGEADLNRIMLEAMKEGKFTASAVAGMHDQARERAINLANANPDPAYKNSLKLAVAEITRSPELRGKIAGNATATQQIGQIQRM